MFEFDKLPQLATGTHPTGSGYACIMNAISYLEGDARITDMPSCVFGPLARMAQLVNDTICTHNGSIVVGQPNVLCGPCSHQMWLLGVDLIGTAEAAEKFAEKFVALPYSHGEGEMELSLFLAHTLIDQAVVRVEKLAPLSAMARLLRNRRSSPWLHGEMKTNAQAALDNDQYFSIKHCNVTWDLPWLHALRMVANRDPVACVLENLVVDLTDTIPAELRLGFAKAVIKQFNEFTFHHPIPPTAEQIEDMRVKAGLVNV